jgi:hypothetical protein
MTNDVLRPDNDNHMRNIQNPEANGYCPNGNPLISFANRNWWINYYWSKATGTYIYGDNGNFQSIFNPKNIERVGDGVRLWIRSPESSDKPWQTSEIVLVDKLGYGRYLITARADIGSFSDLDQNAVFGIFTYQYSNAPGTDNVHREIDLLEVLRGGKSNAQFTLQPWEHKPTPWDPFTLPPNTGVLTIVLDWIVGGGFETYLHFYLFRGDYALDTLPPLSSAWRRWAPRSLGFGNLIPSHTDTSCERLHINLWLMHGKPPASEQSVTVTRFQFKPQKPPS